METRFWASCDSSWLVSPSRRWSHSFDNDLPGGGDGRRPRPASLRWRPSTSWPFPLYAQIGAPFHTGLGELALDLSVSGLIAAALLRQWAGASCWILLDNPATRWLGSRSYSFYLVHFGLVIELSKLLAKAGHGYKVTFVLALMATIPASALAAEVLYRTVERPFLERKRRARMAAGHQPVAVRA